MNMILNLMMMIRILRISKQSVHWRNMLKIDFKSLKLKGHSAEFEKSAMLKHKYENRNLRWNGE